MQYSSALVMAFAAATSAATVKVSVGVDSTGASKLVYTPNDITASVGDSVEFDFFPANHTVTQSSFADPCHPLAGGFFSGFVPTNASTLGSTFTITVKDTKPVWIYCSQIKGTHCQAGMVAAINAPKTGNTLAAFTSLAKNATLSTFPGGAFSPVGGSLVLSKGNSTSSSGSSSSVSASDSSSSATSTYTTSYSTSATITTVYSSTWTSAGTTYTSAVSSATYATEIATAVVTTATIAIAAASSTSTASAGTTQVAAGAASGLSANMIGMGAVILGALAMI
ncbi:putative GPI-anchored cupredoxin [Lachnellula suecica]|uniref:Putative GPI-anchored cupredoxin n=1 Tax=Lachnellula suecica TaxID=602035 RepID=A0A8T9CAM7_9HELO|nr:putative GPI-anchored cupredoxin [Lachnellula suecica]